MRNVYKELRPYVFIYLQQGTTILMYEEDNSMCTLQILAQGVELGREDYQLDPAVLDISKQINTYEYQQLNEIGNSPFTNIQRYHDVNLPRTTPGAFSLDGAAIMLYEVRIGKLKFNGTLTKQVVS